MSRIPDSERDAEPGRLLTRAELLRGAVASDPEPRLPRTSWRTLDEQRGAAIASADEFPEELPAGVSVRAVSRRDFLRVSAAGVAIGGALACDSKSTKTALPLLNAAPEQTPGMDAWYATVCGGCSAGCGALARARDGRPLKLEGNPDHPLSRGGLCAIGQAQLRALYDGARVLKPEAGGAATDWAALDSELAGKFAAGPVRVLASTVNSPALRGAIGDFLARFPGGKLVEYDALSASALSAAHEALYGARLIPQYKLENADALVAIECDFLGGWIDPVGFAKAWSSRRGPGGERPMSRHWQFEAGFSVTGGVADQRVRIAPAQAAATAAALAHALETRAGLPAEGAPALEAGLQTRVAQAAEFLWAARGKALVLCGTNDFAAQYWTARANRALQAEGATLDLAAPDLRRTGDDAALAALIAEMAAGAVGSVIVLNANPIYELPESAGFAAAFAKVPVRVATAISRDETGALCTHHAPDCHFLEKWSDAQPVAGLVGLGQPLINPLGGRAALESFLAWAGSGADALTRLQQSWNRDYFPRQSEHALFKAFWNAALDRGFVQAAPAAAAPAWRGAPAPAPAAAPDGGHQLLIVSGPAGDGRQGNNPLLLELPDPVTRVAWENCALIAPAAAESLGIEHGDRVEISANGVALALPAFVQPGMHEKTVAVAGGWGRADKKAACGANAFALRQLANGALSGDGLAVEVKKAGGRVALASVQGHFSLEGREEIAPVATLAALQSDPAKIAPHSPHPDELLYAPHAHPNHRWAMAVDMTRCSGCSACVVGCNVENNIPVVGRDEVQRAREMHWLRIDRYYQGTPDEPLSVSQPMMCQQCDRAPCENVCPVIATAHSEEGLNEQAYNRCVGTRYCANNCPYKVRRFNWFTYDHGGGTERLGLNPDVTVRSRGVMEKCTFCVQRIQDARRDAANRGIALADGAVRSACEQSCPADAMAFGDLNDPNSKVSRWMKDPRRFAVLGELGVEPGVGYLVKIRNAEESAAPEGGHEHG